MDTLEVLHKARALAERRWGQGFGGAHAHVGLGGQCAWLAITHAAAEADVLVSGAASAALLRVIGGTFVRDIYTWNDTHSHAEVLAAFDRAIAIEEAKAAEHREPAPHSLLAIAEHDHELVAA